MDSRFYYPTNNGSLGEPRRVRSFMSPAEPRAPHFGTDHGGTPSTFATPTVLVVEDDDDSRFVLRKILGSKGYRVLEAYDGKEAVEVASAEELNLILLDLQLPRLNGLGVIRELRGKLNLESLPIVIMTACEPEKYRGNAIAAGCDDFLVKPIDFDRLDAVLDYFIPLQVASLVEPNS